MNYSPYLPLYVNGFGFKDEVKGWFLSLDDYSLEEISFENIKLEYGNSFSLAITMRGLEYALLKTNRRKIKFCFKDSFKPYNIKIRRDFIRMYIDDLSQEKKPN